MLSSRFKKAFVKELSSQKSKVDIKGDIPY